MRWRVFGKIVSSLKMGGEGGVVKEKSLKGLNSGQNLENWQKPSKSTSLTLILQPVKLRKQMGTDGKQR